MTKFVELTFPIQRDAPFDTYSPKAQDRRACVRHLFGSWFEDHGFKLGRDYGVNFIRPGYYSVDLVRATIEIRDPHKAVLFKLRWA